MSAEQQIIYRTSTTLILALSETTIGQVVLPNPYIFVSAHTEEPVDAFNENEPTFEQEINAFGYANSINDLMSKLLSKALGSQNQKAKRMT